MRTDYWLTIQLFALIVVSASNDITIYDRLSNMEVDIHNQDAIINELETEVRDLKRQLSKKEPSKFSRLSSRGVRAHGVHVAFSSYLDHSVHHVGIDSIIPFNKHVLNDGGAFSNITGIFTSPISGVYLFTYTVNTIVDGHQLIVKLVIDGLNISDGISDPYHNLQEIQGGNTVLVRVQQGQSVWLAAYNTGDTSVDGRDTHRFTTFSGVLLYT